MKVFNKNIQKNEKAERCINTAFSRFFKWNDVRFETKNQKNFKKRVK